GVNLLNAAIIERGIQGPSNVLYYMSKKLFEILSNSYTVEHIKDDMEVAIAEINYEKKELLFASSRNRMYYVTYNNKSLDSHDRISILYNDEEKTMYKLNGNREFLTSAENKNKFTDFNIDIKNNDIFFLSSDGYYDQFGEKNSIKYKRKRFEKRLFDISQSTISNQKEELLKEFNDFKGNMPQTDDVTVIGIRLILE
ncbi:MAG: SpoIIE family protein phosphatase, partial [Bacteroidota bacterium]|nr:SpoIIE family protein phosphatase [Bacteroidota bacterium]